jgi:hypothetical protein
MSARFREILNRQWGVAWLLLTLALAAHVVDEALNDFLAVYSSIVADVRARWPLLPLPTFTFETWIALLGLALAVLFLLTLFALQGRRWMRALSYAYAIVMLGNGLVHLVGSIYLGRVLPGSYSSPLLIGAAIFLLVATDAGRSPPAAKR